MEWSTASARAHAVSGGFSGCCNPGTFEVMRRGWCWARSYCCWRSALREALDETAGCRHLPAAARVSDDSVFSEGQCRRNSPLQPDCFDGDLCSFAGLDRSVLVQQSWALDVRDRPALDQFACDPLPRGARRHQSVAGFAGDTTNADLRPGLVEAYRQTGQGIFRIPAATGIRAGRCFLRAGLLPVLRFLGSGTCADVLPDRHLGARPPNLLSREILPVYDG